MNKHVVFMLDNDKDFLDLHSKLLQTKGYQVFATDNLFLLLKYANTALPQWIFIDEEFTLRHEQELLKIIIKNVHEANTKIAIMSSNSQRSNPLTNASVEFIYKPRIWEKIMQITENCCNTL